MTQTMKYPRTDWPIAMFIPDEINTCKLGKYVFGIHIKKLLQLFCDISREECILTLAKLFCECFYTRLRLKI